MIEIPLARGMVELIDDNRLRPCRAVHLDRENRARRGSSLPGFRSERRVLKRRGVEVCGYWRNGEIRFVQFERAVGGYMVADARLSLLTHPFAEYSL